MNTVKRVWCFLLKYLFSLLYFSDFKTFIYCLCITITLEYTVDFHIVWGQPSLVVLWKIYGTYFFLVFKGFKSKSFHHYSPSCHSNPDLLSLAEHKKDILKNIEVHTTLLTDCFGYFTENISQSFNCDFEAKQSCSQFCSI